MRPDLALQMMTDMLWSALLISAPFLAVTLAVGLLISVIQVVTQVQEASLIFIPKMVAAVVALVMFGPWMLKRLVGFATSLIAGIPGHF